MQQVNKSLLGLSSYFMGLKEFKQGSRFLNAHTSLITQAKSVVAHSNNSSSRAGRNEAPRDLPPLSPLTNPPHTAQAFTPLTHSKCRGLWQRHSNLDLGLLDTMLQNTSEETSKTTLQD